MSGGDNEVDRKAISDTSFEIELDEAPPRGRPPVYVDVVSHDHDERPVIPAAFRGLANIKKTARRAAQIVARRSAFHAVRTPFWYLPQALYYAPIGAVKLLVNGFKFCFDSGSWSLQQQAASKNDIDRYIQLSKEREKVVGPRARVALILAIPGLLAACIFVALAPWWAVVLAAFAAMPFLAHVGRPVDKPIIQTAVVAPRYRVVNADVVLRAYYAAGLGNPDKPGQQIEFGGRMSRDALDLGSEVAVRLPIGKTFADAVKVKANIASGFDVTEQQVFLTRDKVSVRSHTLYVADLDPLAIPAGRTPLLDLKPRDIWKPAPFGLDERGRKVRADLLWNSWLIGAQPRKGKTFAARKLALYAALDPYVRMVVVDGKNSPDWRSFALVAHVIIFGTTPNRDGDPIELLLNTLREIKKDIQRRNEILSGLPVDKCPEGKLTRELSRSDPRLRVGILVMEEFQVYFETDDQEVNKEVAQLLSFIMAVGPSAGWIILSSSQKPSGVGAGDVQRLFNRYRDNHSVRFALKCGNRIVSDAVLGGDAYAEGYDASALPVGPEYRGVGILYGMSDDTPIVRTYLADAEDAKKILLAARQHREAAGTLTGMAAGEDAAAAARDVLADVRRVFYSGEAFIAWQQLAARLAEQIPEYYADVSADSISAQMRAVGVESKDGRNKEYKGGAVAKGCRVAHVDAAIQRKQLGSGGEP